MNFDGLTRRRFLLDLACIGSVVALSAGFAMTHRAPTPEVQPTKAPMPVVTPGADCHAEPPACVNETCPPKECHPHQTNQRDPFSNPVPTHPHSGKPGMSVEVPHQNPAGGMRLIPTRQP